MMQITKKNNARVAFVLLTPLKEMSAFLTGGLKGNLHI